MALALTLALPGCMDTKPVRCGAEDNSEFARLALCLGTSPMGRSGGRTVVGTSV